MRSFLIGELLAFDRQLFFCKDNRKNYICSEELRGGEGCAGTDLILLRNILQKKTFRQMIIDVSEGSCDRGRRGLA